MVIKHENVVLFAARYLGAPVASPISEYAKEMTRRHAVILSIDPQRRVPQKNTAPTGLADLGVTQ
jgi:hypothetical protein